jgi:type IV pilus assembly protein PilW
MSPHQSARSISSRGFTLIELLVSMALGLGLISVLVQAMLSHKLLVSSESSLSRVQESGRFVMELITRDIRKIGYHGCTNPAEMNVTVMALAGVGDFSSTSLQGFEAGSGGTFSPGLSLGDGLLAIQGTGSDKAREGSDVIQIKFADRTGAQLTGNTTPVNANIQVSGNPTGLSQGDIAMVADCQSAHVFAITNVTGSGGTITMAHASSNNSPNKMLPGYNTGADLLAYRDISYFVADTGRNTNGGMDVYALYRKDGSNTVPEELVEGVEFLEILYGESVGADNMRFVPAGTAGLNFQNVAAVRIAVLIQDFERSLPENDQISYTLLDTVVPESGAVSHTGGRYLRKVFSTTVQVRNVRN